LSLAISGQLSAVSKGKTFHPAKKLPDRGVDSFHGENVAPRDLKKERTGFQEGGDGTPVR
jgi:hypothetical protein